MKYFLHKCASLKSLLLILCAIYTTTINAQTVNQWKGGTNGEWGNINNWSRGAIPATTDIITFNGNNIDGSYGIGPINVIAVPSGGTTFRQINLINNASVSLQAQTGASSNLTVSVGLSIQIGSVLLLNMGQAATDAIQLNLAKGSNSTIAGTLIIDSTFSSVYNNNITQTNATVSVTGHIYRYGPPVTFYVDPINGNNNNNNVGTIANPYATIVKVRDTLRKMIPLMGSDIIVNLRGGEYLLDSTLNFTNTDGGCNGYNVIYQAFNNEKPIISGGKQITGWTKVTGQNYYVANVPISAGFAKNFRYIWINGRRARQAKSDFITVFPKSYTQPNSPYIGAGDGYIVKSADIKNYSNISDVRIFQQGVFKHIEMPCKAIKPINDSESIILMGQPLFSNWTARYLYNPQKQIQVWNAFEELDEPGEFYLNRTTSQVYYYPQPGEDLKTATIVAPKVDTLITVIGKNNANVQNIQFQGVAFKYGNWNGYLTKTMGFSQADLYSDYTAIEGQLILKYANDITIKDCRFEHLSGAGIYLTSNDSNIVIEGNVFHDLTAAAVIVGHGVNDAFNSSICNNININNNVIRAIGTDFYQSSGIYANITKNLNVLHNDVADVAYFGINQRYNPDSLHNLANPMYSGNTNILYNRVSDFGTAAKYGFGMGDIVAGVYMYGVQSSNAKYNYVRAGGKNDVLETMIYQDGANGYNNTWKNNIAECGNSNSRAYGESVTSTWPPSWYATNVFDSNYANIGGFGVKFTSTLPWSGNALTIVNNAGLQPNYTHLLNEFGNGANIASIAKVTSSSKLSTRYLGANINDGKMGTSWRPSVGIGSWVQLSFPNPISIEKLQLVPDSNLNNPEARRLFEVWVSNDSTFATYNILGGQGSKPFAYYQSLIKAVGTVVVPMAPNTYDLYGIDTLGYKYIRVYGRTIAFSECRVFGRNQSVLPSSYLSNSSISFTPYAKAIVEPVIYNWSTMVWDTINKTRVYFGKNTKYWQSYSTIADSSGVITMATFSGPPTCFNGALYRDESINFKLKLFAGKFNYVNKVFFRMPYEYYTVTTPTAYCLNITTSSITLTRQNSMGSTITLYGSGGKLGAAITNKTSLYNALTPVSITTNVNPKGLAIVVAIDSSTIINCVDTIAGFLTQPGYFALLPGKDSLDILQLTDIPATGISVTPSTLSLHPKDTVTLVATTIPSNATLQIFNWKSSDTTVVTVNSLGLVTANGLGNATITVSTLDNKVASINAKVSDTLLPLILNNITANWVAGWPRINWSVANEIGIDHFEIQKSKDAIHYSSIATIKPTSEKEYSVIDSTEMDVIDYYIIKVVKSDGEILFSKTVSLLNDKPFAYSLSPNPAKNAVRINGVGINKVEIINGMGKVVRDISFNDASNPIVKLDGLPKGVYYVLIRNDKIVNKVRRLMVE